MMKALLILTAFLLISFTGTLTAQDKITTEFKVSGNCGMCKSRIEKALKTEGVESAKWDSKTSLVKIVYNKKLITEDKLHQIIAGAGHDTEKVRAKDEVYNKLHSCCKYERSEVTKGEEKNIIKQ